jgi:hypothetical protein
MKATVLIGNRGEEASTDRREEVMDIVAPERNENSVGAAHSDVALRGRTGRSLHTEATYADIQQVVSALAASPLDGASLKDTLDDRCRRKNIGPAGIEGQVCERLRRFRFRQTIIHRPIEMIWDLRDLA